MTQTAAEIAKRALQKLNVVGGASDPPAEEQYYALQVLGSIDAELRHEGYCTWAADEVPLHVADALAGYLAVRLRNELIGLVPVAQHEIDLAAAWRVLARMLSRPTTGVAVEIAEY